MTATLSSYRTTYHEDSDADDEYERSVITSPMLRPDSYETSPTDSEPPTAQHTPTTYTHSADSYASPTGLVTKWTPEECADWVSSLGLGQYADNFIEEGINGEALVELQHAELKEMGMGSVGHRLTILKSVYDLKLKQSIPIKEDDYVPLSAEKATQDTAPTQDDFARIIQIIKDRDDRLHAYEADMRRMREDFVRMTEENKKLREDVLPVVRLAKDRSQPLPTPDAHDITSPPSQDRPGSSLSRKYSTKKLFLGSAPKNPSPTIHEGRTLTDTASLDPSAAAMAASSHLTASISGGSHSTSQPASSPHHIPQPSPTSPAYSTQTMSRARSHANDHRGSTIDGNWSSSASTLQGDRDTLRSGASRRDRDRDRDFDPPLSAGRHAADNASLASNSTSANNSGSSNPQVEIFKSFRVSIDDPCHKVLPVALKKYNITADWRQYALYIVHGDQERCLGLNEKPLILFKQLDREGRKPMFMLRKHAAPAEGHISTIGGGGGTYTGQGGTTLPVPGGVL
ncbi:uncharacterized protein K452DRAFT_233428 [Aplosporella prunicola CBS 121167]|uniref:SAM domain-containing protein n=1 Tax=Aplosporella prunicola CBS 121167 TaxID=1176127 RepID=A0A6A6B4B5_9PEZI|nr:uncharacterized protein K452DRAFT_233428 [Aplosporella prunicola CBS 121167]KAF2138676.1 hypothetical protein K452DRAFT_233428 [Aplosporella prunicola CBS 121167]